jgi:hypothetical protein
LSNYSHNKVLGVLAGALIITIIIASTLAWINFNLQNQIEKQREEQNNLETVINNQDNFIENLADYFEITQNSTTIKEDISNLEDFIHQSLNQIEITNVTRSGLGNYHALIVQSWANATIKNTGINTLKGITIKTYTAKYKSLADTIEIESLEPRESTSVKGSFLFSLSVNPTVIIEIWMNGVIIESGSFYFDN